MTQEQLSNLKDDDIVYSAFISGVIEHKVSDIKVYSPECLFSSADEAHMEYVKQKLTHLNDTKNKLKRKLSDIDYQIQQIEEQAIELKIKHPDAFI